MKRVHVLLLAAALVAVGGIASLTAGCHAATGTISRAPVAFFDILGVGEQVTASIDEGSAIALAQSDKPVRLQVAPGRHHVQIFRGGSLVVDRQVLVSDTQILEIALP